MRFSRLFSSSVVAGVATCTIVFACGGSGGGGGGGGGGNNPDAKVYEDAPGKMDAPAGSATGLGKSCTGSGSGNAALCTGSDTQCVTVNSTDYFCTKSCGSSTGSSMPPTGGDAMCSAGETTPGTPACALYMQGSGSNYLWSCAIECGSNGSANLGTCPAGLTCTSNLCE